MKKTLLTASLLVLGLTSCNKNSNPTPPPYEPQTRGYYILSEGTYGRGDGKIAYYDLSTSALTANLYPTQNSNASLGDTPIDLKAYGSKLYCTVNNSNKVRVLELATGRELRSIEVESPRYLACKDGKVYVTLYTGKVSRIDTVSLAVDRTITSTGGCCEGLAILDNNLYVANSGRPGDAYGGSGTTVSIINLATFAETGTITTPANPNRLTAANGKLYLTTWGDYFMTEAQLHEIDPATRTLTHTFAGLAASRIAIAGDYAYTCNFSYISFEPSVKKVRLSTREVSSWYADPEDEPIYYDVAANAEREEVYYFGEGGSLYCFDLNGTEKYTLNDVGLRPNNIAFRVD